MYPRIVKARGAQGVQHEYVRLVEAYRDGDRVKQRTICNLGRRDLLAAHLDAIVAVVSGDQQARQALTAEQVEAIGAWDWGPLLVARQLWQQLGLDHALDRSLRQGRRPEVPLSERVFVLVANRLCEPSSEHGLARWLEEAFVCDRAGRRWLPQWRDEQERRHSRTPRVRVDVKWLDQWYRTLDQLYARKEKLERELYLKLRDLFSLQVDLVFYDVTSTYFEGHGPPTLGAHGHSRDGKPRNRQVVVGVVMVDGWPIAQHVFRGNFRDAKTVPTVLADLEQRFGLKRVVFVGDRGMVTSDNLALLREKKQGYLVGLNRRRNKEVMGYLEGATGEWTACPVGIGSREQAVPPRTLVQEVRSSTEGVRVFVVHSDERQQYEQTERLKAMARVRTALEGLERRVAAGRIKAPEKVGAAATRILSRHHGQRYYRWEYQEGRFRFFESENLAREKAYEGKYLIQTEEKEITAVEAVQQYKELAELERGFSTLKDVIEMRPIWHKSDQRVEAHIFVAGLSLLLHRALEKKLKAAGLDLSATEALAALRTVRVVDIALGAKEKKRSVTRGSQDAARILRALGVTDLEPPTPKSGRQGTP